MVMKTRSATRNGDESLPPVDTPFSLKLVKRGVRFVDDSPPSLDSPRPLKVVKRGPVERSYAQVLQSPVKKVISSTMGSSTNEPDNTDRTTWQSFHMTTQSKLSYLLYNKVMADISFVIGKDEIPAHRFVLALNSPVFYAMFNGPSRVGDKIELTDCNPEAFHQVLKFMYTEEVAFHSKTVLNTLLIAKKYGVVTLEKACLDFILKDVCADNAFLRLSEAHQIGDAELVNRCLETIDKQPSASFQAEEFVDVSLDDLCRVLVRSTLAAPEIVMFRAAKRWAEEQCKRQELPVTPENQRKVLGRALFLIRFPLMTVEEFSNEVAASDLLTEKESLLIFKYLSGNREKVSAPFLNQPRRVDQSHTRIYWKADCCFRARNRDPTIDFELCFFVRADHRVHVDGFGFERSDQGGVSHQIKVFLKRTTGEILGACEKTFITPADGKPNQLFKALLPNSVEIQADVLYHIEGSITVNGLEYMYRELSKPVDGVVSIPEYGNVFFCFLRTPSCIMSNREVVSYVIQGVVNRIYFHCS